MLGSVARGDGVLAADEHLTVARFFDDLGLAFCQHLRVSDQGHEVVAVEVAAALELGHDGGESVPERGRLRDAQVEVVQLPGERGGQGFAAVEAARISPRESPRLRRATTWVRRATSGSV